MSYLIDFLKGGTLPHKHKNYEIIIFTKGESVLYTEKKAFPISAGTIMIIPPGSMHNCPIDDENIEQIYIRGDFNKFFSLTSPTSVLDNCENEALMLSKIIYQNRHTDPEYVNVLIDALNHFLLGNIKLENEVFKTTRGIAEFIGNNFHDSNISLNDLLKKSGYAEDYIRAQFKSIMGKTPTEFLTEIRINHACYLIDIYKNTLPLSEIAERCSYSDYAYFSRRFKQHTGVSPRRYMESNYGMTPMFTEVK